VSTCAPWLSALRRQPLDCVLCGRTVGRRCARSRGWNVVRCGSCGLRRTWPAPDPELLERLYDDGRYYRERGMGDGREDEWADRAREVVALLGLAAPAPLLDFGAGYGGLVAALRARGFAAEGVEVSSAGRAAARERGVELHAQIPGDAAGRFGAITMLHVLEHVADPVATLAELRHRLRPGGRVLVEVPNAGSVDALWPPLRPLILDLPFHLHHFTPRTLAAVVTRAGFAPLTVRRFNPLVLEWALARRRPRSAAANEATIEAAKTGEGTTARASDLWRRALPNVRRVLPGFKLQLIAEA
jgi:SAM-dependent methyltransferase